jgi:cyclopropane fatty-acyl-phospholipid synthase-like methyltransferase
VSTVEKYKNKKILEIGNVLSHYIETAHDVLDKYELAPGVINEDVVDFRPKKKYDLIISVSTMEHVGWTYGEKRDSKKFLKGLNNLKSLLKKNGKIVVTFPVHYREDLTNLIRTNKMPLKEEYFLKRVSYLNDWKQIDKAEALAGAAYEGHFANANVLYVGMSKHK